MFFEPIKILMAVIMTKKNITTACKDKVDQFSPVALR